MAKIPPPPTPPAKPPPTSTAGVLPTDAPAVSVRVLTWQAEAQIAPLVFRGSREACAAWCRTMQGRQVCVQGPQGLEAVGVITATTVRPLA
ncbi:MAG TPA: hypothetical protein VK741_25725 [Acetobacteraceae bacterium]|nr:hypothetical protein [Acetobacteraceae bacterium]